MKITEELYLRLLRGLTFPPPETGGIIGAYSEIICRAKIIPGIEQEASYGRYTPDVQKMNREIYDWQRQGINFLGIFHTHFPGGEVLSHGDIMYIETIMRAMPDIISELLFPIVLPEDKVVPYKAAKHKESILIYLDDIEIIGGNNNEKRKK